MITILDGMDAQHDMFGTRYYEDMDNVVAFLSEQAVLGPRDFVPLLQDCAKVFPLLDGVEIEYCEISGQAISASALSKADQERLRMECANPCMVYLGEPPKLFVTDTFRQLDRADKVVGMTHELVHLEQFVRGDTYLAEAETQIWKGKPYYNVGEISEGALNGDPVFVAAYLELPWEREAIERSEGVERYREKMRAAALRMFVRQRMKVPAADPQIEELVMRTCLILIQKAIDFAAEEAEKETPEGTECGQQMAYLQFDLTAHQGNVLWELLQTNDSERTPLDDAYAAPYVDKLVKTAEAFTLRQIKERESARYGGA